MLITIIFILIGIAIAATLSSRRLGPRDWQTWSVYGLVIISAFAGKLS